MTVLLIEYPKCSTCQKAKKWLIDHHIDFITRNIVEENPKADELTQWLSLSGEPLKRFFNTSGLVYKSMDLKNKLPSLSDEERLELLSGNGMLVKRPLLIGKDFVLIGFNEKDWSVALIK